MSSLSNARFPDIKVVDLTGFREGSSPVNEAGEVVGREGGKEGVRILLFMGFISHCRLPIDSGGRG